MSNQSPLTIGSIAPLFTANSFSRGTFMEIDLSNYKGKYVLLFFYVNDFYPLSCTELLALNEIKDKIEGINTILLACSSDSLHSHRHYFYEPLERGGTPDIDFPLLSDTSGTISDLYNARITQGELKGHTSPSTYLIDRNGIIKYFNHIDPHIGRNIDEVFRTIQAVIYSDDNGEIDPMNWIDDKDTKN